MTILPGGISKTLLWSAIFGVIYLPVLSYTGYAWFTVEYLTGTVIAMIAGLVCATLSRIRSVGSLILAGLVIGSVLLYFGHLLKSSLPVALLLLSAMVTFAVVCWLRTPVALTVAGYAALAQIMVAALQTPPMLRIYDNPDAIAGDLPTIFHFVLDEHAATGALPEDAIPPQEIRQLEQKYVSMGFMVFRHAYSRDAHTWQSLSRILNPDARDPESLVIQKHPGYSPKEAAILHRASETRTLDLIYNTFFNLDNVPGSDSNVARRMVYDVYSSAVPVAPEDLSVKSRTFIAVAIIHRWFKFNSPAFQKLTTNRVGTAVRATLDAPSRTQALISKAIFEEFIERMDCCSTRGTYNFLHLIWPHYPYVYRRDCSVRPSSDWLNNRVISGSPTPDTLETRRERYRQYFEQTTCLASRMKALIDVIDGDAIVLLHSDHGSRITIEDRSGIPKTEYDDTMYSMDTYGAFAAIRMPGVLEPGVVEDPVAIDTLVRHLSDNGFTAIDLNSVSGTEGSPYRQ